MNTNTETALILNQFSDKTIISNEIYSHNDVRYITQRVLQSPFSVPKVTPIESSLYKHNFQGKIKFLILKSILTYVDNNLVKCIKTHTINNTKEEFSLFKSIYIDPLDKYYNYESYYYKDTSILIQNMNVFTGEPVSVFQNNHPFSHFTKNEVENISGVILNFLKNKNKNIKTRNEVLFLEYIKNGDTQDIQGDNLKILREKAFKSLYATLKHTKMNITEDDLNTYCSKLNVFFTPSSDSISTRSFLPKSFNVVNNLDGIPFLVDFESLFYNFGVIESMFDYFTLSFSEKNLNIIDDMCAYHRYKMSKNSILNLLLKFKVNKSY